MQHFLNKPDESGKALFNEKGFYNNAGGRPKGKTERAEWLKKATTAEDLLAEAKHRSIFLAISPEAAPDYAKESFGQDKLIVSPLVCFFSQNL